MFSSVTQWRGGQEVAVADQRAAADEADRGLGEHALRGVLAGEAGWPLMIRGCGVRLGGAHSSNPRSALRHASLTGPPRIDVLL